MSEQTERLDAIQKRATDCLTYNFGLRNADTLAHSDVPYLLDLARKQRAALALIANQLEAAETLCRMNGTGAEFAVVPVGAVREALEAKP